MLLLSDQHLLVSTLANMAAPQPYLPNKHLFSIFGIRSLQTTRNVFCRKPGNTPPPPFLLLLVGKLRDIFASESENHTRPQAGWCQQVRSPSGAECSRHSTFQTSFSAPSSGTERPLAHAAKSIPELDSHAFAVCLSVGKTGALLYPPAGRPRNQVGSQPLHIRGSCFPA